MVTEARKRNILPFYYVSFHIFTFIFKNVYLFAYLFVYLAVTGLSCGMWDLVPWPGMELWVPYFGSLSHWTTRRVPQTFK